MPLCFVCEDMASKPKHRHLLDEETSWKTEDCILCARYFCDKHKLKECDYNVCEINHQTYYRKHPGLHSFIFPSLEAFQKELKEQDELEERLGLY